MAKKTIEDMEERLAQIKKNLLIEEKFARIKNLVGQLEEAKYKVVKPFSCYADRNREEEVFFTTAAVISSKELSQNAINRLLKDGVIKKL